MIKEFLKIAGVKNEKQFYNKYPSEAAFFKAHPEAKHLKSMKKGGEMKKLEQLTDFGNPPKFQTAPYAIPLSGQFSIPPLNLNAPAGGSMANPNLGAQNMMWGTSGSLTQAPVLGGTTPKQIQGMNLQTGVGKQKFDVLGKLGGIEGIANIAGGVIGGIQGLKAEKKALGEARTARDVSALTLKASRTRAEAPRRQYNRPEDQVINPNELYPTYGTGTNVLAKDGAMIGGNPTEIQNMYNPGDLYSNLGYEPMSESDVVKQYAHGGGIPRAAGGFMGVLGDVAGSPVGGQIQGLFGQLGSGGAPNAGSGLGKTIGGAAGSLLGPVGGFVGGALGGLVGGMLDKNAKKIKDAQYQTERNLKEAATESGLQGIASQYGSFMKHGGRIYFSQDGSVIPDRSDYMDYEEGYQAAVDDYLSNMPVTQPSAQKTETKKSEPEKTSKLNPYEGVSVYDFLQAQGKAGDYQSRKQLAKKLGIEGYKGTAEQNKQLMDMIKKSPDVLTDYTQSSSSSTKSKSKAVSAGVKGKPSSGSKSAATKPSEPKHSWDYTPAYDFGAPAQTFVSASKTPINKNTPGYGKKTDPYARVIEKSVRERGMTDYSTQQYFNEQLQKTLGEIGISGLLPGVSVETTLPYYGSRAIPYVTATARHARRAIPYATRALGYENGGDLPLYEEGGWVSHDWQPQVITKFGEHNVKDLLQKDTMMDTLRTGGRITQNNMYDADQFNFGGQLQTTWGGRAETMSYNPYLPGSGETVMFKGNSHEEKDKKGRTGIGVKYGNNGDYSPYMEYGRDGVEDVTDVEVEKGEPATELQDSTGDTSMVVFGNLKIPNQFLDEIGDPNAKGKKFKHYAANLSKQEAKQNKIVDKASQLIDIHDDGTPFGELAMNSARAMMDGANQNLKNIAQFKQSAAAVQNAINETAEEHGIDADALAKGKIKIDKEAMKQQAKWGKAIKKAQDGVNFTGPTPVDYLNNMYSQIEKETNPKKKGELTEMFQKEFHRFYPEQAKEIILETPKVTKKGQKAGIKSYEDLKSRDINTILGTNVDKFFGERTKKYKASLDKLKVPYVEKKTETTTQTTGTTDKTTTAIPVVPITPGKKKTDWLAGLSTLLPYLQKPYQEPMDMSQLYPEMMALSMNTLEPVKAQGLTALLKTPYDISLQDQLNEITAAERAAQKMSMGDPSALANIAAQSQAAKQKVLGEQFRMNQGLRAGVYGENRDTLNQLQRENQAIYAEQQKLQDLAKAKTKATALEAMQSMSDKIAKNKLENRTLAAYSNMFPNYRFTGDMRALPTGLTLFETPKVGSGIPELATNPYVSGKRTSSKKKEDDDDDETTTGKKGKIVKKKHFNGSIVRALKNI